MKTVTLRIKKEELDLIRAGTKKHEWRAPTKYYWSLLGIKGTDGIKIANPNITAIQFINGYAKDAPRLLVECKGIRPVRFQEDTDIPEDNFKALKGQKAFEITLGNIIK